VSKGMPLLPGQDKALKYRLLTWKQQSGRERRDCGHRYGPGRMSVPS
jgi:hypothetical protein